ncbi:MAG: hypothetical protein K6E67_03085 [Prevotella sp.]|nr:hypothetical protein [Prevotella sp.]
MKQFMQVMGYNCPETVKEQVKTLAQVMVIGAVMAVPIVAIMAIAGWIETMVE